MASIDKRPNGKYLARWREYPGGPQKTKTFARKLDAERWKTKVEHDLLTGVYVSPEAGRTSLDEYYRAWLARMAPTWRPGTLSAVTITFEKHVLPILGDRPLNAIRKADVEALCASLHLAPSSVAVVAQHAGQLFRAAVEDGLIVRNPAARALLPRNDPAKPQPVPPEVVAAIEAALPDWLRVAVPLGIGAGLRQGEASGLTVDRVHFLRRTLRVDRQLIDRNVPEPVLSPPKTESSNRTVPLASFVLDALSAHLAAFPAKPGDLVLRDPAGRPVDSGRFGHQWRRACRAAGAPEGLRYHALRHTFASTLLSRGVSVKAVADWLGHASPVITLSTYAHLMPADEDVARGVLDAALAPGAEKAEGDVRRAR
jgi:integrase